MSRYLDCNDIFGTNIYKYNWNDTIKNKYINDFEIILPTSDYTSIEINDFIKLFETSYRHLNIYRRVIVNIVQKT